MHDYVEVYVAPLKELCPPTLSPTVSDLGYGVQHAPAKSSVHLFSRSLPLPRSGPPDSPLPLPQPHARFPPFRSLLGKIAKHLAA